MIRSLLLVISILCFHSAQSIASPLLSKDILISPKYNSVALSPNGRIVSGIQSDKDFIRLFIYDLDDERNVLRSVLKLEDDFVVYKYFWVTDELIYLNYGYSNRNKTGTHSFVFLSKGDDGKLKVKLESFYADGYLFTDFSEDERRFYVYGTPRDKSKPHLYHMTLDELINEKFSRKNIYKREMKGAQYYAAAGPDELFSININEKTENIEVWHIDNRVKETWNLVLKMAKGDFVLYPVGMIGKGKLAVLTNQGGDRIGLYEYDINSLSLGDLIYEHPTYDLYDAEYDYKNREVLNVKYYDHGRLAYEYLNPADSNFENMFSDKQISTLATSINSEARVVGVFDSSSPTQLYHVDSQSKKKKRKLFSVWPTLDKHKFSRSEVLQVKNSKGNIIEAFLTRPHSGIEDVGVLLVNPHGGPIGIRDHNGFDAKTQFFVERGFSVLKVNFRGSSGYGKEFLKAGVGEFGAAIESDISLAVEKALSKYSFDKICAMGSSYGAYSSMMLAINGKQKYDCVIAKYGIYDLPFLYNETSYKTDSDYRQLVESVVGPMKENLYDRSPAYLTENLDLPILLIAGERDEIASVEHTKRLEYALKKHNKNFETLYYKKVGHGHESWEGERHQSLYIVDFLNRALGIASLSSKAKNLEIEKYRMIADFYSNGRWIDANYKKASKYYSKAVASGDESSSLRLAKLYESTELFDLTMSAKWYQQASKNGNWEATLKLASIAQRDSSLSLNRFELYQTAVEQGAGYLAEIGLASEKCIGELVPKDVDACFSVFDFNGKLNTSDNARSVKKFHDKQYVYLLEKGSFTEAELKRFIQLFENRKKLSFYPIEVNDVFTGGFKTGYDRDPQRFVEGGNIKWIFNDVFGIEFIPKFLRKPNKMEKLGLIIKWERLNGDEVTYIESFFARRDVGDKWYVVRDFTKDEKDGAVWRLKVMNLDGSPLHIATFNIQ